MGGGRNVADTLETYRAFDHGLWLSQRHTVNYRQKGGTTMKVIKYEVRLDVRCAIITRKSIHLVAINWTKYSYAVCRAKQLSNYFPLVESS
eukprot:scaffold4760_cov168-Skeletonema_marinoi.AAC.3